MAVVAWMVVRNRRGELCVLLLVMSGVSKWRLEV